MMQMLLIILIILPTQIVLGKPVGVLVGLPEKDHPIYSLYHSQDKSGQYIYGYATPTIARSEAKDVDGVTRGGYSYIDTHGVLQTVHYTADALNGFRVAATNLPRDLPDVAEAKARHIAEFQAIKADRDHIAVAAIRTVPYSNPIAVPFAHVPHVPEHQQLPEPVTDLPEVVNARNEHLAVLNAAYASAHRPVIPLPTQDLPEVLHARAEHLATFEKIRARDEALRAAEINLSPVPEHIAEGVVPVKTVQSSYTSLPVAQSAPVTYAPAIIHTPNTAQFKAQDQWGQYSYGYVGPHSSHTESRTADGVTRGGYSYIDANGIIQTVHYIADAKHGFRVAASNLPIDVNHVVKVVAVPAAEAPKAYTQEIVY